MGDATAPCLTCTDGVRWGCGGTSGTSLGLWAGNELLPVALRLREDRVDGGAAACARTGFAGQYVSIRHTDQLADIGASASVGSVADSYDNAMAEALNGTFKAELIEMQGPWRDVDQVEQAVFQWVTWCNEERLHSALDYVPPAEYERNFWRSQEATPQSA
jgi:putative transposase